MSSGRCMGSGYRQVSGLTVLLRQPGPSGSWQETQIVQAEDERQMLQRRCQASEAAASQARLKYQDAFEKLQAMGEDCNMLRTQLAEERVSRQVPSGSTREDALRKCSVCVHACARVCIHGSCVQSREDALPKRRHTESGLFRPCACLNLRLSLNEERARRRRVSNAWRPRRRARTSC